MPIFAIFGHFLAIFGRFGPFLDREHQKQCNCNLLGATGPTNYINMVSNGYLEIWSVSDPKTNSGAKQDPKLTWGGQNWSFCTLCSPTNLFYTKNVNSEMVTSKSYFLAWNRPTMAMARVKIMTFVGNQNHPSARAVFSPHWLSQPVSSSLSKTSSSIPPTSPSW